MKRKPLHKLFQEERETLKKYKEAHPELFVAPDVSEKEMLSQIGIDVSFGERPTGYIRLYLHDFIVEEISLNKKVSEVTPKGKKEIEVPEDSFTLYADLVKAGLPTFEAVRRLSEELGFPKERIGTGGLKDTKALTSQRVALSNINQHVYKKARDLPPSGFFLSNFSAGKGTISPGGIYGNRFIILARTKEEAKEDLFIKKIEKMREKGMLNFYYAQRFGTPRFLSHLFGKLILQGRYDEAVFSFLFDPGLKEIPLFKRLRKEAGASRNWNRAEEIYQRFPYTFRNELRLLSYLKKKPNNFIGALYHLRRQTTLWLYAYSSYLFNQILSCVDQMELPEKIPLLFSDDPNDRKIYQQWLEKDNITDFKKNIKPFKFIFLKKRLVPSRVKPENLQYKILPEGIIQNFVLKKGSYATTVLINLFKIVKGEPVPEWLSLEELDIKKEMGMGSIKKTKEILGEDLFSLQK